MNGRSSKAAGVTKFRLKRVESDTNGRMQNARYGVDGLRTKKQDTAGNSSREYGVGISTSASTPLTQNSTAPSISYISGPMILGAEINGEFVYHLGDALSTVRDVVDDEGDVIRSFEFDEYGNMLNSSGSGTASPKTWIGGLSVNDDRADSGLWNMGHRNYAGGVIGRFISRDPIGFSGSSLNLYAYPTNPVGFVDPSGLNIQYIETGPSGGNLYQGHSAIYIDGYGLFSLNAGSGGVNFSENMTVQEYIEQNKWRGVDVYKLKTTKEQDRKLGEFLSKWDAECTWYNPIEVGSYATGNTCAGTIATAFEKAGILPPTGRFNKYLPATLRDRLIDIGATRDLSISVVTTHSL